MNRNFFKTFLGFFAATVIVAFFTPMALEGKLILVPFGILMWTFIVVAVLVPISALPIYLIVTAWLGKNYLSVLLAAMTSTVFVASFFVFPFGYERSVVNGVVLAEDGSVTIAGYLDGLIRLGTMSIVGFLAGNAFYFSVKVRNES